jgi:predicted nucleic acid-binding protein
VPDLVLDTDVSSLMWRDAMPWQLDRQLLGLNAAVTFVTLGEALTGASSARWTAHKRDGIHAFYEHTFSSLNWKEEIPEAYGFLRGEAAAAGYTLGQNDCWIAACCVSHGLPLLTRNRKHFEPLEPLGLVLL